MKQVLKGIAHRSTQNLSESELVRKAAKMALGVIGDQLN
jgi:hypothetical protein